MEGTGGERVRLARFDFVTRAERECARDHRKALILGMPVWRYLVAGWDHEANDKRPRFAWITLQDGDLGAFGHRRRRRAPLDVLWIDKGVAFSCCYRSCKTPQNNRDHRHGDHRR